MCIAYLTNAAAPVTELLTHWQALDSINGRASYSVVYLIASHNTDDAYWDIIVPNTTVDTAAVVWIYWYSHHLG